MKRYTFTLEETELAAVRNVQEIFRSKHLIPCTQHLPIRQLLKDVAKEFEKK